MWNSFFFGNITEVLLLICDLPSVFWGQVLP